MTAVQSAQCLNLIDQAQVTHGPALNLILFNQLSLINSLPRRSMIKVMEGGTEPVDYHLNVQTNKLHPSDVDTPEPDEKSIITYVSQLYDVFPGNVLLTHSRAPDSPSIPEPPPGHPLFDAEAQKKFEQFKELASSLHQWIREHITIMQVSLTQSDTQHQSGPAANIDNQ